MNNKQIIGKIYVTVFLGILRVYFSLIVFKRVLECFCFLFPSQNGMIALILRKVQMPVGINCSLFARTGVQCLGGTKNTNYLEFQSSGISQQEIFWERKVIADGRVQICHFSRSVSFCERARVLCKTQAVGSRNNIKPADGHSTQASRGHFRVILCNFGLFVFWLLVLLNVWDAFAVNTRYNYMKDYIGW